ncbi:MAG TPA: LacI family transcriptional regulator, partial [Clostridiaceae bacterium]|nr:LacI family transcriptional regulator [Clostridiaceae bacterium]
TIKDIARIAGISSATVSRALNKSDEVSEQTRQRILEICEREGYQANVIARSLISQKSNVIGLIIPEVTNPFYSELALAIELRARELGYNIMLCNDLYDKEQTEELFNLLLGHQVDGIILSSSRNDNLACLQQPNSNLPIVLLGDTLTSEMGMQVNCVSTDNVIGGKLGGEYLIRLGHKDIIYFGLRRGSLTHQHRFEGLKQAADANNANVTVCENTGFRSSMDRGYELGKELFQKGIDSTAIFAANDAMALGLLRAADEYGIKIPEDISLLGFDNIVYTSLPKINLTTISQQQHLLGPTAVEVLIETIENNDTTTFTHKLIRPQLIERSSCRVLSSQ